MRGGRNHIYNAYGYLNLAMFRVDGLVGASDPDPNFRIYIYFGQPNMEGNASVPSS